MTFWQRLKTFLEDILALKIRDDERISYADDPLNVFNYEYSNTRPLRVAGVLAIILHILLFLMIFPSFVLTNDVQDEVVISLKALAQPAQLAGGAPPEPAAPEPEPVPVRPEPTPILVPIPDPTPMDPEPIRREDLRETPQVVREMVADLNIGDISAPPGVRGRGQAGSGTGPATGTGPGAGSGSGPYEVGGVDTNPVPIVQTIPSYTDQAIKAKVQGVVLLQAIIRRDGSVTDLRVLRGLGYGLEEKAIQEIASNWKFRPGTLDGRPVDVLATIEVTFNLR